MCKQPEFTVSYSCRACISYRKFLIPCIKIWHIHAYIIYALIKSRLRNCWPQVNPPLAASTFHSTTTRVGIPPHRPLQDCYPPAYTIYGSTSKTRTTFCYSASIILECTYLRLVTTMFEFASWSILLILTRIMWISKLTLFLSTEA